MHGARVRVPCRRELSEACRFGAWLAAPLSVSVSIMCMQATNTLHPPGAATALIGAVATVRVTNSHLSFLNHVTLRYLQTRCAHCHLCVHRLATWWRPLLLECRPSVSPTTPHHTSSNLSNLSTLSPFDVCMCPLCHYVFQKAVARTGWMFIITPALTGSVILVLVAVIGHNATGVRSYPKNWW